MIDTIFFVKFYRVKDWIKNLGIPLIALVLVQKTYFFQGFFLLFQLALAFAYSFAINDFFDHFISKERNYLGNVLKQLGKRKALFLCILPLFGIFVSFIFFSSLLAIIPLTFIIILFTLYSVPPFRLKRHYILSLPINSLCIAILPFLFILSFYGTYPEQATVFLILFFLYIFFHEIIHQIAHFKYDKKSGIRSFPVVFDFKRSLLIIKISLIIYILIVVFFIFINPYSNFIFVISILFSFYRLYKLSKTPLDLKRFSIIRNKLYGVHEFISYLIILLIF